MAWTRGRSIHIEEKRVIAGMPHCGEVASSRAERGGMIEGREAKLVFMQKETGKSLREKGSDCIF